MRKSVLCIAAAAAAGLAAPAAAQESYIADLSGAAEVPDRGDPNGTGLATLDWDTAGERMCYALAVEQIGRATAAHVHRGGAGEAGPPVMTLDAPGADGGADGCVEIEDALRTEIRQNPSGFYVNVHNDEYPGGALRGQLER